MPERALPRRIAAEWQELVGRSADAAAERPAWLVPGRPVFAAGRMALFAQLEEVLALWSELRGGPVERYADRFVNAGWTLKDLLGHLASWAAEFRSEAETLSRGGSFDYSIPYVLSVMGPNAWNAEAAERQKPVALAAILDQFEEETGRLQDLVLALPEERLYASLPSPLAPSGDPAVTIPASVAQTVLGKCRHDRYHIGQISRWLERLARHEPRGKAPRSRKRRRTR